MDGSCFATIALQIQMTGLVSERFKLNNTCKKNTEDRFLAIYIYSI